MAIDPITGMVLAPVIGGVVSRLFGNDEAPEPSYSAAGQQATNFGQYAYDLLSGQPAAPTYTFNGQTIPAGDIRSLPFRRYAGYTPQTTSINSALQRLLQQQQAQGGQTALRGLVGQQPDMSELQNQLAIAQRTGNTDALNQILGQARTGYQQMMGGQYGYTPEEVEMQRAKLRSELDRSNMEQQRAIQARYGASGLRGGTAASAAMKQSRDYLDAMSSGMADIGLGAAEARRTDTRAAQQIAANLLGIGGTAASNIGQLSQQQQAQLLQAAGQLADIRNQARATGISGAAQLGQLEQGAYDTQVRGATALDELLQNQAQFNETQRLAGAQMNEAGRQFDVGIDATAQDQRNRLAATAAEAPYNQWKDRISMAISGLGGTANAAVGTDRNALETYGQRYQATEDASRGWGNLASNVMDYYLRTRRTPTQTAAGTYRSGYYGPGY